MTSDETIRKVARALWDYDNADQAHEWREMAWNDMGGPEPCAEVIEYICRARALDSDGLLAPSPLREEWAARYTNGGGSVCRTRDEAEAELDRMIRDSHRPRIDEPPAPEIAGIYVRHVTDWETS